MTHHDSTMRQILASIIAFAIAITVTAPLHAQQQTAVVHVDGDNGVPDPPNFGQDGWGSNAYEFLQDALEAAEILIDDPNIDTIQLWVASTDPSNPYVPDRDAAIPGGTGDPRSTFLVNFNNVQLLGGFPPGGGDLDDRNPALYETVLSGVLQPGCGVPEAGGCFLANGTPACDNAECCEAVCAVDPACCQVAWDQRCADLAFTVCGSCGDPGAGGCFVGGRPITSRRAKSRRRKTAANPKQVGPVLQS